ncbi:4-(cytidine 5'-diphospho)-2-C-methyl-D-erythritol kinase [Leptolyngbya sp. PCC 6406]|uniref:4-(cytidine 5'-diphospho)-2-C-methyl-D-erythritol kinase n=1 Tax=Leptolyngbya sp. PCC 6406 TaxID=1173264 RepID=UPI0002ABB5F9|nr:4-(cytidine 5'-diphospho)-2-C-methyl-D-erythritol kinase [Leptolyngbya sp. PCC 6406]
MRLYSLLAAAKINLYLEIMGHRRDGFHELVMVMQSVDLADRVTVRSLPSSEIRVQCDHPLVPQDATNLAHRAAALMAAKYPQAHHHHGGVEISIEKQIPVGAGLAGGSANAAAVLVGLDMLWQLGLTQGELQTLGAELGSDVPFCIGGGTAIATGRGEQLDSLPSPPNLYAVLGKYQSLSVSTPWAYGTYRQQFEATYLQGDEAHSRRRQALHSGPMVSAIAHQDSPALGKALYNDLEKVVLPAHPAVADLKAAMVAAGGLGTLMSGSGPTVFTLTTTREAAETIQEQVRDRLADPDLALWVTRFSSTGVQLTA